MVLKNMLALVQKAMAFSMTLGKAEKKIEGS